MTSPQPGPPTQRHSQPDFAALDPDSHTAQRLVSRGAPKLGRSFDNG